MRAPGFASPKSRCGVGTTIAGARLPDRRGHATDEEGGRPRATCPSSSPARDCIAPVAHRLGPCRRLEPPRRRDRTASWQHVAIVRVSAILREGVEALSGAAGIARSPASDRSGPRTASASSASSQARADRRIGLEEQIGARDLAVEVLRELERACRERRAPLRALGLADLPEPAILQHRQQHDQAQQRDAPRRRAVAGNAST